MKTVLVPVDFSTITDRVVSIAADQARWSHARIVLLHVAAPNPDFVGYEPGPQTVRNTMAHAFHREHQELHRLEEPLKKEGLQVTALLVQGPTVEKILHEAEQQKADLIVMGSHGHGALHDLLMGSVTEGVLRKNRCPLLLVPSRIAKP